MINILYSNLTINISNYSHRPYYDIVSFPFEPNYTIKTNSKKL